MNLRNLTFGILFALAAGCSAEPVHIVLMHTNDIHGQLQARNGVGGIAEIAGILREAKPDLVVDAGDLFTGTYLSDRFQGEPTVKAMNAIGYLVGTIGNHEFDFGQAALGARVREAKFPLLTANIATPIPEIGRYAVRTVKGIRFGFVGVTTEELAATSHPRNLNGVQVSDVVESIRSAMDAMKGQTDFTIVLAHVNDAEERRIAEAFPEVRLIVGGHNHAALGPIEVGTTTIAKTGSAGRNVGRVDLDFVGTAFQKLEARLIPVENVQPDPEIAGILAPYVREVDAQMAEVVGEASAELASSNSQESALADMVADAMRQAGGTQIGIQNTGGIRARIAKGPVTWGGVFEVLPFTNTLVTLKLTGAQLKEALGVRLLAVSGLRVRVRLDRPEGQRLVSATLADGTPIDDQAVYTVSTNDFVVAGGDGLGVFGKGADIEDTGILLRDAFMTYLKEHSPLTPKLDGRVRTN